MHYTSILAGLDAGLTYDLINEFDTFYFGTLAQRNQASRETLNRLLNLGSFKQLFCDLNLRMGCYSKDTILSSINHCNVLKLNDEEVAVLSRLLFDTDNCSLADFWKFIHTRFSNVDLMIVTLGKKGCSIFSHESEINVPSEPCIVKDTIRAGDAFSATFLSSHSKGHELKRSAQKANKVGAFVASKTGAIPKLPDVLK